MKNIPYLFALLFCVLQSCTSARHDPEESFPVVLSDSSHTASCVFLTTDENNRVVVSWVEIDSSENKFFFFAGWDADKNTFSSPKAIPMAENASIHEEGMPKIAFKSDGTLVAIYETNIPVENSRFGLSDIQYLSSSDRGKTWTEPQSIQKSTLQQGSVSFANILRLDDGEIGLSWLGTDLAKAGGGRPVQFARTEGKNAFSAPITIDPNACQCCRTAISSDGEGHIRVLYRDILPGSVRDISLSSSTNNGKSFQEPASFSNDNWVLEGCPHNGPSVVSKGDTTYVAWYTGSNQNGVFYAELDQNNEMIHKRRLDAEGRFVQLCLLQDGTRMAAYNKNYTDAGDVYSKIMINKINAQGMSEKEISTGKSHASYPVVQQVDDQNILVAWSDDGRIRYRLVDADQVGSKKEEAPAGILGMEDSVPVAISNDTDPVCGMKMGKTADLQNTVQHNGKTIGFCGQACKKQFRVSQ